MNCLFVQLHYCCRAILVTRSNSTPQFPYEIFWPYDHVPENQFMENFEGNYILIGHSEDFKHFQSLVFVAPWRAITCQPLQPAPQVCSVEELFKRFKKMDNVLESIVGTINLQIPTMPPKVTSPITLNLQNLKIPPKGTLPTTLNVQIPPKPTVSLSTRFLNIEKKLEKECVMHSVQYYQPVEGESIRHNKKRRKLMRSEINSKRAREAMSDDDIDFRVELAVSIPDLLLDNCVLYVLQSIVNHIVNDEVPFDRKELHPNPKVHEMVAVFTDGELKHQVATCQCCNEIRPQFHSTMPSDKFKSERRKPQAVPYWNIFKDGLCERFHKESYRRKKSNNVMTFSGLNSCGIDTGAGISHNNMHFAEVTPFLANLTFIETLMIRKITVVMYVHNLKYGMLASKGHAVAIPQDIKLYTKLPLLPAEIGILILKNSNTNSKRYVASRQSVQNALNGLVFDVPKFGVALCLPGYRIYLGNNRCSGIELYGKYLSTLQIPIILMLQLKKKD